ncbi:unnamed protein product [Timema podura]|uniref:C2H2-type domain-containing protein n=1 Tax=Timema podura TaxID=61482 RepID=A0ABN7NS58_TIMPD|nr:unnamed protein product [Timema podura]
MYNGYKNPEMCFNNQTHFDNQTGFPIGDAVSKQTSAPPWDYTPQPYNSIPNYSGETHLNHRQVPVIHNQNIPQFDRKENALNITGHDNNNPLVHYSTNNNTHQSIVRPTALVNCHSNCNACCNHSNRVSHHWNVTSDGRYLDNSSSLPKDLPRYPSISSYSHEESKFIGDFASSLNKLSRFSREKANPNRPGFVPPAVEQDHVSPIVNSSAKALNTSSAVSSDSIPVKKDSCATCQGGCQSSCRFFKHQSSVQFPSQDNIHQDQHSLSTTQENVVRYMGHTTLNNVTSNQWNMSNRPQTGMWLPNGHHPPFWVQPDSVRMNASGSVSFWGDRNEEISSNISQPMRSSFHGMARYKSHMMNQKVVRLHEAEQKKIQDIARYHEVQRPRYQDPSSNKSEENYQDPGRYHDAQRKAHSVQFHDLPKQSSQTLNYSEAMNKEFAGHSIDGLAPSSTKLQGISRNTITSSELGQGVAAPYPVEQDGTRRYTDISNAHPARSMATNFNTSSQANINFTTGIAQPPSRFSSHVTYTQSKITKTNNYMQCIYPPIETSEKNTNFVPVGSKMAYANSEIVPSNRNQYTSVVKESGSNFEFVTNSVDKNSDVIKYCDSKNSDPGPNYSTLQPCNKMSDSAVLGKTMQVVDCPGLVKTKPYFCNQTLQGSNNFYSDIPRYVQTKVSHSYENLNGSKAYHMFGENNMPANFHSLQQTYQMNPIPAQNSSSAISSNVSILPPDKASSDLEDSSYVNEHNPNIYNRSSFEDGTGRYIKKRRSRLKGISKKSQNLHSNKNNQTLRQYLANWDEECDDVTTNPKLPDVVPSNNVEPVLVLDYRSLGNDGLSSLQADVGIGRPADSGLIQMTYQAIDDMNTENKQSLQNIPEECEHIDGNIGGASLPTQKTSKHVEPTLEGSKEKEPLTNTSLSQDCQHLEENPSEVTLSPIEDYSKTNSIISPCVPERDLTLNEQEVLEHSANNRVEERKGNIVFHQSAKESLSTTEEHTVHNFETLFNEHSSDSAKTNFATGTPSSSVLECPSIGTEDQSPSYSGNQSVLSNQNTDKIPVSDSLLQKSLSTSKNINISNEAIDALLKDCAEFSESGLLKLHSQEEVETQCNNVDIDENIDDILQTVNHQDNTSTSSQNTIFTPINSENKDVVVSENSLTTRTSAIVSSFVKELEKNKEQTQIQPKRIDFKSLEKNTILTPCHNTFVDSEICEIPSKQNKLEIKPFSKIVSKQILTPEEETTSPCHTPKEQFITNVEKQDKEAEVSTSKTSQSSFKNESSIENILGDSTISYSNKENLSSTIDINNVKTYNKLTMQSHSQLVGDKNISEPESETMERGNIRLFSEEILNFDSKGALNLKMKKENETSTPDIYFECQPSSINKDATSVIMELTSTDTNKCNETSICDQGTLETSNSKELQANIIQNLSHKQTLATNSEEKSITLLESPVINEVSHMCVNQHSHIVHCCNTEQHSLKCCEDTDLETLANKHISSHTASITACEEPLDNVSVTNVLDISTNGTVSSINTEAIPQENDLTITRTCSKDKFVIDLPGTDENKTKESTLHSICSHKKFKCDSPKLLRIQADTHTSVFESKAMEVQENGFENNFDNNTNSANVTELSLQYEGTEFVEQSEETHIWPVVVESNMPILDSTQIVIVTEDDEDNTGQIGIENTTPCHETNAVAVPISPEMPCLEPFTLPENVVAICNESDFEMPILNVSENASLVVSDGNRMPQLETTMSSIISTSENNDNSSETLPQSGEHERHLEYDATSFQESIIEPYKSVPHNYTHGSDSLSKPFIFERHCHEESLEYQIIRTLSKEEDHPDLLPGTSNVKVCLTPKSHHEREGKTWCVVDPSGSGESSHCSFVEENNNDLVTASQNTKQDELYNNQVPIVLVKKLVLKRGADGKIANECEHLPKFTHSSEDDDGIKQTDAANAIGRKILINTEERNTTPCSNVLKNADIELNSMSLDIEAIEKNLPSTLAKRLEQGRSNIITSTNSPRMCDSSAGCSLSGAESCDGSEKHVPRVIIKRTGSGTNYKSFLRESSYSTNFWQPVVRIQRNKDLDNLSRSLVKSDCPKKVVHLNRLRLVIRRQSSFEREKVMKNNVHQVAFVTNIDPTSMNEIENVPSVKKREESLEKKEIFTYAVENNAKKNKLTSHKQRNELNTRVHDTEIRYLKHNKPQSYGQLCFVREKERLKCPTIPERNKVRAHNEIKKKHSEINCISQSSQSHSYDGMKDQCNVEKNERKGRRYSECSHNILGYHIAKVSRKRISEGGIDINEKGKNSNAFADNIPYYKKRFAMGSDYEEESTKDSTKDNQTGSKESGEFVRHRSSRHPRTKEQHHCLLCQRTFPTLQRHQLHLSGHLHRHLETAQRRTIHTLFRLFTGNDCPALTPLSEEEASGVSWFPAEGGAIHFYHQAPPLQIAVQVLLN